MPRIVFSVLLLLSQALCAEEVLTLWPEGAPNSKLHRLHEYTEACGSVRCTYQVSEPTLTVYRPEQKTAAAVIILPGGNYQSLALEHEGHQVAKALAQRGILGAVLKYRLPNPATSEKPESAPEQDVHRALQILRDRAESYGLNPRAIGVMGFSAGSHLAALVSVRKAAQRPDFSLLIYGVSEHSQANQQWVRERLLYRDFKPGERESYDLLAGIDAHTPPAFLVHALDDDICPYRETTLYAQALTKKGVAAEVHLFARGGHGFGLGRVEDGTDQWLDLAVNFIAREVQ